MIFCISNLVQYYGRFGMYSRDRLEASGHTLATRENIEQHKHSEGISLVMVHTYPSFVSWIIMWSTSSIYSHGAMLLPGGVLSHMTTSGHVLQPILDLADNRSYLLVREVTRDPIQTAEIVNRSNSLRAQNLKYNWTGAAMLGVSELLSMNGKLRPRHLFDLAFTALLAFFLIN